MIKIRNIKLYNLSIPEKDYSNHLEQKKWNDHFSYRDYHREWSERFGEVVSF